MINEKKIPDEIQPAKPNWRRRLLISALKSPISTILILAFLYFAFQAYRSEEHTSELQSR